MHLLPRRKNQPPTPSAEGVEEAAQAVAKSQDQLAETEGKTQHIEETAARIRKLRTKNHFSEALIELLTQGNSGETHGTTHIH